MSTAMIMLFTAVLSFMPISELRGAIPFAIANGMPWYIAFTYAVVLNSLVVPACWIFLATFHKLFYGTTPEKGMHWYRVFFDRFVERARQKLSSNFEKWGWLGIIVFVAIPLPLTGAWTGTIGAWVLGVSKKRTILAVVIGVFIAGIVVTAVVMMGIEALNFFVNSKWRGA